MTLSHVAASPVASPVVASPADEAADPAVLTADNRRAAFSPAWGAALAMPAPRAASLRAALIRAATRCTRPGEATRTPAVVRAEQRAVLVEVFGEEALAFLAWGELLFAADMCLTFAASPRRDPLACDAPRAPRTLAVLPGTPDPGFTFAADVFARYRVAREDLLAVAKVVAGKGRDADATERGELRQLSRELPERAEALGKLWGRRIPIRAEANIAREAMIAAGMLDG